MTYRPTIMTRFTIRLGACFTVLICGGSFQHATAQLSRTIPVRPAQVTTETRSRVSGVLSEYHLLQFDPVEFEQAVRSKNGPVQLDLGVVSWSLLLREHDIRSKDSRQLENGRPVMRAEGCPTFRGREGGSEQNRVAATIWNGYVSLMVNSADGTWFLDPLQLLLMERGHEGVFALYRSDAVMASGTCSTPTKPWVDDGSERGEEDVQRGGGTQQCLVTTNIATEIDFFAFQNITNAGINPNFHALGIINFVSELYRSAAQIEFVVSLQHVWVATPPDYPYPTTSPANGVTYVDISFPTYFNANFPWASNKRAMAVLLTDLDIFSPTSGNNSLIGRAKGIGVTCGDNGYCINEIMGSTAEQILLVAHEMGHVFDGEHCDGAGCGPSPACNTQSGTIMCGVCCTNTPVFTSAAATKFRQHAIAQAVAVPGCFSDQARTLSVLTDDPCYFGNCAGALEFSFDQHTVETDGTMPIGNVHGGLIWNGGGSVFLKPGYHSQPNDPLRPVIARIVPCDIEVLP